MFRNKCSDGRDASLDHELQWLTLDSLGGRILCLQAIPCTFLLQNAANILDLLLEDPMGRKDGQQGVAGRLNCRRSKCPWEEVSNLIDTQEAGWQPNERTYSTLAIRVMDPASIFNGMTAVARGTNIELNTRLLNLSLAITIILGSPVGLVAKVENTFAHLSDLVKLARAQKIEAQVVLRENCFALEQDVNHWVFAFCINCLRRICLEETGWSGWIRTDGDPLDHYCHLVQDKHSDQMTVRCDNCEFQEVIHLTYKETKSVPFNACKCSVPMTPWSCPNFPCVKGKKTSGPEDLRTHIIKNAE